MSQRLIDEGFDAILLEPGPVGAFNAKTQRGLPEVICATFEAVGFPEASLSAMGLFDVLEHIEDDMGFLARLHRALKPGGRLYLTVPALQSLWSAADVQAQHYRRYSRGALGALLEQAGFDVVYSTYLFQLLLPPLLLLRSIPFRLGVSRERNVLRSETEHATGGGLLARCFAWALRAETERIRRGRRIFAGTSLLAVVRKDGILARAER